MYSSEQVSDLRDDLLNADVACMFDPLLHMGVPGESPDEQHAREDVARELCADCPMRATCLEYAMAELPEHGIWAGLDPDEIRTARAIAESAEQEGAPGTAAKHAPGAPVPNRSKETSPMMTQPQPPVDGDGRDVPLRARPRRFCSTCRTALSGGPVVFTCSTCRRDVHASRLPTEWNRGEAA